jgi:hypothetical protein
VAAAPGCVLMNNLRVALTSHSASVTYLIKTALMLGSSTNFPARRDKICLSEVYFISAREERRMLYIKFLGGGVACLSATLIHSLVGRILFRWPT